MKALYSEQEIKELLQKCGFELKEHLNPKEMTELYFKEYNNANPARQMQAPMGVGYVFAEKMGSTRQQNNNKLYLRKTGRNPCDFDLFFCFVYIEAKWKMGN